MYRSRAFRACRSGRLTDQRIFKILCDDGLASRIYLRTDSVIVEQMTKIHQFAIMCAPTNSQYAAVRGTAARG